MPPARFAFSRHDQKASRRGLISSARLDFLSSGLESSKDFSFINIFQSLTGSAKKLFPGVKEHFIKVGYCLLKGFVFFFEVSDVLSQFRRNIIINFRHLKHPFLLDSRYCSYSIKPSKYHAFRGVFVIKYSLALLLFVWLLADLSIALA